MKINFICFKQKLLALAICCFLFAGMGEAQTSILVTYYNGTEQGYSITTSGKLYFENGSLQIAVTNASAPVSLPVSIIRKITFSNVVLPLQLVDFTIFNEKAQVRMSWKTENEVNTSHFDLERSSDGANYESIGQVVSSNSSTGGNYSFADQLPLTGISYYRLKQVDADGKYVYSRALTVNRTSSNIITILPNPASDYFRINSTTSEKLYVKIYSVDGQLMVAGNYASGEQISISKLRTGMYVVFINNKPYKLIKQ